MADDLILKSLEIRNFRGIRELTVRNLGRVNLIVGKNNVGKTTVLEALRVYARPGSLEDLLKILSSRDEMQPSVVDEWNRDRSNPIPVDRLFYGRRATPGEAGSIIIGPLDDPATSLSITLDVSKRVTEARNASKVLTSADQPVAHWAQTQDRIKLSIEEKGIRIRLGPAVRFFPIEQSTAYLIPPSKSADYPITDGVESNSAPFKSFPFFFVHPNGLGPKSVGRLWDNISLSPYEQNVVEALRIISPEVDRVALKEPDEPLSRKSSAKLGRPRIPYARIEGQEEPIPLRAMGDGIVRVFGIVLSMVNARAGFLLVDEIENGIHYSVQVKLWQMVFRLASRLNVQVFATTHSYDCIRSFEQAARESDEDGVLIRLAQKAGRTLVGEFDERELGVAVDGQIEVR
jgi:hypothetical protein